MREVIGTLASTGIAYETVVDKFGALFFLVVSPREVLTSSTLELLTSGLPFGAGGVALPSQGVTETDGLQAGIAESAVKRQLSTHLVASH